MDPYYTDPYFGHHIPSLNHNYQLAMKGNQPLIQWLEKQYKNAAETATI